MRKPNAGELSKTIAGQWSKSQKREQASREIMEARRQAHATRKRFAQQLRMQ